MSPNTSWILGWSELAVSDRADELVVLIFLVVGVIVITTVTSVKVLLEAKHCIVLAFAE